MKVKNKAKIIKVNNNISLCNDSSFVLIAGPCVIETELSLMKTAEKLKEICTANKIPLIFKTSYDKANRTSIKSYRGPGLEVGIRLLKQLKRKFHLPILTDVHKESEVEKAAEVADILQIPAFLCRQTDLILSAARTKKIINIKKGQFLSPHQIIGPIAKIESTKNKRILLTERGTTFGYNNLVVDFKSLYIMKKTGYPVILDVTHSIQEPGALGTSTGGNREYIPTLAKAGCGVGIAGIFVEVHQHPDKALSDAANSFNLKHLSDLLMILKEIDRAVKK